MPVEQDSCGFGLLIQTRKKASHQTVLLALKALSRLTHRGAVAEDGLSGDGCGLMLDLDAPYFLALAHEANISLSSPFALGMFFLDKEHLISQQLIIKEVLASFNLNLAGWRPVPINHEVLGVKASRNKPEIIQAFIEYQDNDIDRRLFIVQKILALKHRIHVVSLSTKTVIYKGLILPPHFGTFFKDLMDKRFKSRVALFHQRFSTNTLPSWHLAQPFSVLAHNGEINTIRGNLISAKATTRALIENWYPELNELPHLMSDDASDSMSLDEFVQSYQHFGMAASELLRLCIPPAWEHANWMNADEKAYYAYHAPLVPAFEGPAGIVFYDGQQAGCILDRNGFRPARLQMSAQGFLMIGSEVGLLDIESHQLVQQKRIKPGSVFLYDVHAKKILANDITPEIFSQRHPYPLWVKQLHQAVHAEPLLKRTLNPPSQTLKMFYDVSYEEEEKVLKVMAELGVEPTASMGDDTPLAPLSDMPRALFDFFRQQFAQVTNPPVDSLREKLVMSSNISLGSRTFIGKRNAQFCRQLCLDSPLLGTRQLEELFNRAPTLNISLHYQPEESWQDVLQNIYQTIISQTRFGHVMCLLQDDEAWIDRPSIHPMFALGFIHQRLVGELKRDQVSLVVSSGFVRDPHHLAMLVAGGADAVHPWLAYRLIDMHDLAHGRERYRTAMNKGLLKIASKMGVCTINSYRGSLLFQVLGLKKSVTNACFASAPTAIWRYDWDLLQKHQERFFYNSQNPASRPRHGGLYQYAHDGEYHDYHPEVVMGMINASKQVDESLFNHVSKTINQRNKKMLRDYLTITPDRASIDINLVEDKSHIQKRFETAAMSLGALSPEAHEALAIAMNQLGGRSNSGEGGEASYRHNTAMQSKIKQVASGRFGVTAQYLMHAEVIQIKIAQGAKPGEGGQLPGNKVNQTIAELRYCLPGVTLISPPPHHDIYSIEDLAQLIFDLKQLNPKAFVSVKLVSEPGIGTIAVGVVKAYADCITISGYDGGTGASPLSSIRHAGCPWELGLIEVQQCLIENDLRHKVTLQVDGGLKTGLDIVKAALLGAETFGFGTAPMVALGCKYLRICHLNNCATGIATQQKILREQHFQGNADRVIAYFNHVAKEVQEILATLGYHSLQELIGRWDLLKSIDEDIVRLPSIDDHAGCQLNQPKLYQQQHNHPFDKAPLGRHIREYVFNHLKDHDIDCGLIIANHDRSIGASVAGLMSDYPDKTLNLHFKGHAGQSFGAFNTDGMHLLLTGSANDYVGKGMSGGSLTLTRPKDTPIDARDFVIAGNTCLYGATGGYCFMDGLAGERFAVRNSGAHAVVVGVGYHGCEYMTNGVVVILSSPLPNFAAGMTGGLVFVRDTEGVLDAYLNKETVAHTSILNLVDGQYYTLLESLLDIFCQKTSSTYGYAVQNELKQDGGRHFYIVYPKDMKMPLYQTGQAAS